MSNYTDTTPVSNNYPAFYTNSGGDFVCRNLVCNSCNTVAPGNNIVCNSITGSSASFSSASVASLSSTTVSATTANVTDLVAGNMSTDGTFADNSDAEFPSQKAAKTYIASQISSAPYIPTSALSTDGTFAANSDALVPSQKAAKTYVASQISSAAYIPTSALSTDGTFAANSDALVPSQKAAKTYIGAQASNYIASSALSTDGTFAANSDTLVPSQKATKTYVTAQIPSIGTLGTWSASVTNVSGWTSINTVGAYYRQIGTHFVEGFLWGNGVPSAGTGTQQIQMSFVTPVTYTSTATFPNVCTAFVGSQDGTASAYCAKASAGANPNIYLTYTIPSTITTIYWQVYFQLVL